jgi:hypothetical protein
VFEDKWGHGKAHAWENIDAPRLRALKQPEGCGPSNALALVGTAVKTLAEGAEIC